MKNELFKSKLKNYFNCKLSNEVDKSNNKLPTFGYEKVLQRSAQISINLSYGLLSRVLQLHCDTEIIKYFNNTKLISLDTCSDNQLVIEKAKSMKEYHEIIYNEVIDDELLHRYRSSSYQIVINAPSYSQQTVSPSLISMSRIITSGGHGIIGGSNELWRRESLQEQLVDLTNKKIIKYLSLQVADFPDISPDARYSLAVFKNL